ncbi:MAG TPA: arylsulfotransferase family protein [Conexibacter sp.]|jgi:hypothetical protein
MPSTSPTLGGPRTAPAPPRQTRPRTRLLALAGCLLALVAIGVAVWQLATSPAETPVTPFKTFHSEPSLDPDGLTVAVAAHDTAPGFVFLAVKRGPGQDGPMITDNRGRVVWFHPVPDGDTATAFKVQQYRGRPVLTWWQGHTRLGHGNGEYIVMNTEYRVIARVRSVDAPLPDHHDFQLLPDGNALMTLYSEKPADLSAVGGPRDGTLIDSRFQEVNVATGRLVWQWRASKHVPVTEGMTAPKQDKPHDYFHINAINQERDGNFLISARNTHAVYEISRRTGSILWRLGGKRSGFKLGPGASFAFQHDVRRQPDGTITMFDNEATPAKADQSRGIQLRLNMSAMTATLVRQWRHPDRLLVGAEGNVQTLPNGDVFTSWGQQGHISELTRDGRLLFDLVVPHGSDSYQAFRSPWRGRPLTRPAVAAHRGADGRTTVWASWNGATNVRRWRVVAGDRRGHLKPIGRPVRRAGFETALTVQTHAPLVAVRAIGVGGRALKASRAIAPTGVR